MLWYPYSQHKTMKEPYEIEYASGVYLYTKDKKLIDSVSSWWSVIHGYNHPELNSAINKQLESFAHVMQGGLSHKASKKLAKTLESILPGDLNHVFFSDSGSVGVEVALKMAIQFYSNHRINKNHIIALNNSYHGDTFKTMEIGDDIDYHLAFPSKNGVYHINSSALELEEVLKSHHKSIAALIVEPLLQGAGGMRIYSKDFLISARELCNKYDILLIFDEVATGFGRTGHMFVSELVQPDILVLGKALTAGYIGHAATIANDKVFKAFYSNDPNKAFMHGPTFMGNALACSVALKSIEIFLRDNYIEKIKWIESYLNMFFKEIKSDKIKDIRIIGACACIEVYDSKTLDGFSEFAYQHGVWNRPFLNYCYTMPPYIINEKELDKIIHVFKKWFEGV